MNSQYGPTSGEQPWTVKDGVATLSAKPTPEGLRDHVNNHSYISGELNTYHSFSQTYGYFEIRAQLPKGQGFWPAFWLMPQNGAWPPELDAMEVLGNSPSTLNTTVHSGVGGHTSTGKAVTVADTSAGYHTYGVDWEPDTLTWYFDGQQVFQAPTPSDMHSPMYMIANLAVGGNWPGPADGSSSAHMNIDYIRAYAAGADPTAQQSPADGSALAAAPGQALQVGPTNAHDHGSSGAHIAYVSDEQSWPGVSEMRLIGASSQTVHGDNQGDTFWSNNNGNTLLGGAGDDTFHLGRNGDVVSGGGGNDTYAFAENPWSPSGEITDFNSGDVIDLTETLQKAGYVAGDPVAQGYVKFAGSGAAEVWFNPAPTGGGAWWLVADLDGVAASALHANGGLITV